MRSSANPSGRGAGVGGGRPGKGGGRSASPARSRPAVSTRDSARPLPAAPDGDARGAAGTLPARLGRAPSRQRAPRARDWAGVARVQLAGSLPGRPEPLPRSQLARGSRSGTQPAPAGLRGLPASASPAGPQQEPPPWPGQERRPLAAPCPGRTPGRPVTCAQVLGRPGQRRSHGAR